MNGNRHFTSEDLIERLLHPVRRSLNEAMGIMARGLDYHRLEKMDEPVDNPPVPWAGAKSPKALEGERTAGDHPTTHRILVPTDLRSGKSPSPGKEKRPDSAGPLQSGQGKRREDLVPPGKPALHRATAKPETGNGRRPRKKSSFLSPTGQPSGATPALPHNQDPGPQTVPMETKIPVPALAPPLTETGFSPVSGPQDPGALPFPSRPEPEGDGTGIAKYLQSEVSTAACTMAPAGRKERTPVESEKNRFASGSAARPVPEPGFLQTGPLSKTAAPEVRQPPPESPIHTIAHPGSDLTKMAGSSAVGKGAGPVRSGTNSLLPAGATAIGRIDDPSRLAARSIPGASKPVSSRSAGHVPLAKPMHAAARRAAAGVEPVLEQAYAVTRRSFGTEPEPGAPKTDSGGIERVSNTFNVNVALSADTGLKTNQRQALEEALVDILRASARRQGLEL